METLVKKVQRTQKNNSSELFTGLFFQYVSKHAKETPEEFAFNNNLWNEFTSLGSWDEENYVTLALGVEVKASFAWRAFASFISPGQEADSTFRGTLPQFGPEHKLLYSNLESYFVEYAIEAALLGLGPAWNNKAGLGISQANHWTEIVIGLLPFMKDKRRSRKLLNRLLFRLIDAHMKSNLCSFEFFPRIMLDKGIEDGMKKLAYLKLRKKFSIVQKSCYANEEAGWGYNINDITNGLGEAFSEVIRDFDGSFDISILASMAQFSFCELKLGETESYSFLFDTLAVSGLLIGTSHFSMVPPWLKFGLIQQRHNSKRDDAAKIAGRLSEALSPRQQVLKEFLKSMSEGSMPRKKSDIDNEIAISRRRKELLERMK